VESIEASGKSVEEAIARALVSLGKRRNEVEITVLQDASRGTFGLGSKDARVRVTVRSTSITSSQSTRGAVITPEMADALLGPNEIEVPLPEDEEDEDEDEDEELLDEDEELLDEDNENYIEEELEDNSLPFIPSSEFANQPLVTGIKTQSTEGPVQELQDVENASREDIEVTVDVLQHILRHMNIHAAVQVRLDSPLTVNIHGMNENLGLLIGRRGETLAALQLLVNLIVSHRTKHRLRIVVDAENYRQRREENLRSLALRVAQQVRSYRRSIALEAMPPYERRIVHIALSDSKDISTESIGEGDERRVVISLKRPSR
jgi:spoIIIJ-associated protein